MISYEGMKAEASTAKYPMLPEGPQIAEIRGTNIEGAAPNQTLVIRVEVTEGEYKDYFTKRYQHDKEAGGQYEVRYKGDYRLRIPHPQSSSQYPDTDKKRFNDAIYRIEKCNPDYHWDGDETRLKGLKIGINMQKGTYNGSEYTTIGRFEIIDDIRKGLVTAMRPKKPRTSPDYQAQSEDAAPASTWTPVEVEIPF